MRRIRLTVAYDGTNYCGWQIQPNGITIEEVLNKAICKLTGEEIQVIGASRTDSGVHARGNIAVFDTESRIPAERFSYALNQRLPKDIVVVKSDEVDLNWHPRYQDTLKTYEYHIINTKVPIPTERLYNYFVSFDLDVGQMRRGAAYLEGEHDLAPFCCIRTNAKTTVRTITDLQILQSGVCVWHRKKPAASGDQARADPAQGCPQGMCRRQNPLLYAEHVPVRHA